MLMIPTHSVSRFALFLFLALTAMVIIPAARAQERIDNFREIERTDDRLVFDIDYAYSGSRGSEHVFIYAMPVLKATKVPPRLFNPRPSGLEVGRHSVRLAIERSPKAAGLVASDVEVCMLARAGGGNFHCQQFALSRPWGAPPTPSVAEEKQPRISLFTVRNARVEQGDSTKLSWHVANATSALLGEADPRDKTVINRARTVRPVGSIDVLPDRTTTYVLQVTHDGRALRKEAVVTVLPQLDLVVDVPEAACREHSSFQVKWTSKGATKLTLNGRNIPRTGSRRVSDHRRRSSLNFHFVARNDLGSSMETTRKVRVIRCDLHED